MALAWKAGWVNSPQGFESPILRRPRAGAARSRPRLRIRGGAGAAVSQGRDGGLHVRVGGDGRDAAHERAVGVEMDGQAVDEKRHVVNIHRPKPPVAATTTGMAGRVKLNRPREL